MEKYTCIRDKKGNNAKVSVRGRRGISGWFHDFVEKRKVTQRNDPYDRIEVTASIIIVLLILVNLYGLVLGVR